MPHLPRDCTQKMPAVKNVHLQTMNLMGHWSWTSQAPEQYIPIVSSASNCLNRLTQQSAIDTSLVTQSLQTMDVRFPLGMHSMCPNKCTICIHHYRVTQSRFTALQSPMILLFIPPSSLTHRNHQYFHRGHHFTFSRCQSYNWSNGTTLSSCFTYCGMCDDSFTSLHCSIAHFSLVLGIFHCLGVPQLIYPPTY